MASYATGLEPSIAIRLLRLSPLILSTGSLMCAVDQTTSIRPFTTGLPPKTGGVAISAWFPGFFERIGIVIATAYPLAITTALVNTLTSPETFVSWFGGSVESLSTTSKYLYWAGAVFSAGHFLYGPYAMNVIGKICKKETAGELTIPVAHEWLRMNRVRIATVDFWGWFMYLCAVVTVIRV